MEVKPIGVFHMADEKGPDEKLFVYQFQILFGIVTMIYLI